MTESSRRSCRRASCRSSTCSSASARRAAACCRSPARATPWPSTSRSAPSTVALLRRLDAMVLDAGGRVYLGKDSYLDAATFRAMYPRIETWLAIKAKYDPEGLFTSNLARRVGLVRGEVAGPLFRGPRSKLRGDVGVAVGEELPHVAARPVEAPLVGSSWAASLICRRCDRSPPGPGRRGGRPSRP